MIVELDTIERALTFDTPPSSDLSRLLMGICSDVSTDKLVWHVAPIVADLERVYQAICIIAKEES